MDLNISSFESLLIKQADSTVDNNRRWNDFCNEYIQVKADAGYTLFNQLIKRALWWAGSDWKALALENLAVPETTPDRVIDRILVAQSVDTGVIARIQWQMVKHYLSHNKDHVREALQISLKKHGRDVTIATFELAVELGWFKDNHADHWLEQLRQYSDDSHRRVEVEVMPVLMKRF